MAGDLTREQRAAAAHDEFVPGHDHPCEKRTFGVHSVTTHALPSYTDDDLGIDVRVAHVRDGAFVIDVRENKVLAWQASILKADEWIHANVLPKFAVGDLVRRASGGGTVFQVDSVERRRGETIYLLRYAQSGDVYARVGERLLVRREAEAC